MKHLIIALTIALLIPAAAMAKGECNEDVQKFCKDMTEPKDLGGCMKQHHAELSDACKAAIEAMAKEKGAVGNQ